MRGWVGNVNIQYSRFFKLSELSAASGVCPCRGEHLKQMVCRKGFRWHQYMEEEKEGSENLCLG